MRHNIEPVHNNQARHEKPCAALVFFAFFTRHRIEGANGNINQEEIARHEDGDRNYPRQLWKDQRVNIENGRAIDKCNEGEDAHRQAAKNERRVDRFETQERSPAILNELDSTLDREQEDEHAVRGEEDAARDVIPDGDHRLRFLANVSSAIHPHGPLTSARVSGPKGEAPDVAHSHSGVRAISY